ncbi:Spore coat protein U (SCPU) domain-containing protein [Sphingobium faniae]|nr:Spore coat protein U (SCPU) domain-containing protein [Sphingobium faniae]
MHRLTGKHAWPPIFGLWALMAMPGPAQADTTASFEVSATIVAGCAADGVGTSGDAGLIGTLDFGNDTTLSTASHSAALTGNQMITLRCTPGVALSMRLGGGQHASGGNRNMQLGPSTADRLPYRLYANAGMTDEITIDQDRSILVTAANMNDVQLHVYGQVSLPGGSAAGTYTDTLLVTLTW